MTLFTHTRPDGRLVFHGPSGEELVVTGTSVLDTDDPAVVRFLDEHPSAKRATTTPAKSAGKARRGVK